MTYPAFKKIPRLSRECVITEKIDGTNGLIYIPDPSTFDYQVPSWLSVGGLPLVIGSRNRWLSEESDNFGFFKWCKENAEQLITLGPGYHYGEWWGPGIQRGYGIVEKRFSLFHCNVPPPSCVSVVPILYKGPFSTIAVEETLTALAATGSIASPGFMRPEGVVVYHTGSGNSYKKTFEGDKK